MDRFSVQDPSERFRTIITRLTRGGAAGRSRHCFWIAVSDWHCSNSPNLFDSAAQCPNIFVSQYATCATRSTSSRSRFITAHVFFWWETSYLTRKKTPRTIARPDLSLFWFACCDFQHHLSSIFYLWLTWSEFPHAAGSESRPSAGKINSK